MSVERACSGRGLGVPDPSAESFPPKIRKITLSYYRVSFNFCSPGCRKRFTEIRTCLKCHRETLGDLNAENVTRCTVERLRLVARPRRRQGNSHAELVRLRRARSLLLRQGKGSLLRRGDRSRN